MFFGISFKIGIFKLCYHIKPYKGCILGASNSDVDDVLIAGAEDTEEEEAEEEKEPRPSNMSYRNTFSQNHFLWEFVTAYLKS